MIWRFLVRRSQTCSLALKRLLIGVVLLTAAGIGNEQSVQAVVAETTLSEEKVTSASKRNLADLHVQPKLGQLTTFQAIESAQRESSTNTPPQSMAIAPEVTVPAQPEFSGITVSPNDSDELVAVIEIAAAEETGLSPIATELSEELTIFADEAAIEEQSVAIAAPKETLILAQNPNSNTEPLPEVEPLPEEPSPTQTIEEPTPIPTVTPTNGDRTVAVGQVQVTGSTVFGDEDFAPILADITSQNVSLDELSQAADRITQLYLEQGYITSRAIVVEDSIGTDTVELRVIEGKVDEINLRGNEHVNDSYLLSRLRLGAKQPLNTGNLEDQLRLLKLNPIIDNIEATLKAGEGVGESDLDIIVTEANTVSLNLGVDNFSPASVGSERITANYNQLNLTGGGDRLGVGYIRTTRGGAESLDLNYTRPINAKDGTITLRGVWSRNKVIQEPFDVLDIRGESERYELSYRQPIIRNPREEFALGLGFTYQDGLTFLGDELFGFNVGTEDGKSTTSVLKFSQEYIKRQPAGAWSLRSQFSIGTGLFDATSNDEPIPDGHFWSWLGQIQRVKLLNPNNLLVIQADLQLTPDTLLPSQQFVIGGGQSLRGFRQNARSADNGFRFSVEDRITLARDESGDAVFQLAPFFDMGTVWNSDDNPNTLADQKFLAGLGLGAWWQIEKGFTIRFDYALPLVDLDDRGDNWQDDGLYFNVNYLF